MVAARSVSEIFGEGTASTAFEKTQRALGGPAASSVPGAHAEGCFHIASDDLRMHSTWADVGGGAA